MRDYLKTLRTGKGYTMQEMADMIGISKQYYQLIEAGDRQKRMDITLVQKIALIFGISLEKIVEEENKIAETA